MITSYGPGHGCHFGINQSNIIGGVNHESKISLKKVGKKVKKAVDRKLSSVKKSKKKEVEE